MKNKSIDLAKFENSAFRSKFNLDHEDRRLISVKGMKVIRSHARTFISMRLGGSEPRFDGKQTPFQGHPVFKAQHATATCCRGCLEKWHGIEKGKRLLAEEIEYIVGTIMDWIERKCEGVKTQVIQPAVHQEVQLSLF